MNIEDIKVQVVQHRVSASATLLPFIKARQISPIEGSDKKMHRIVPVWLQLVPAKPFYQRKDFDVQLKEQWNRRLLLDAAFGKPLAHQTLADYDQLEPHPCGVKKANMIGVYELLKEGLPEGDEGDVFFVSPNPLRDWKVDNFIGVWADSKGAAKLFLEKVCEYTHCAENFKLCGIDPARAYDWRDF